MMRAEISDAIKGRLSSLGVFGSVCGLVADKPVYPLAKVWAPGCPKENLDNSPQARIDLRVAVQIETHLERDADGNSIDSPLYNLVDQVFSTLHGLQLPGRGSQPMIVFDSPGLSGFGDSGQAVYLLQVSVRVMPELFSLT
ncbi:hypothetical protein Despr_0194 [Desulfobulbus propionicus DSM 2032]|uniref:DUF3168 domain-containing protein n=1 Tax=Desulfobulbus propionicus (strain ATCC 33891 / DSM 2032 / VKM B-1956 / 1pr3) TaxID=577650 RepID=A0A7U3YJ69_DESPD|nr:hypothetical protein [Desulfobulbus propionicus]ADW16383.1 hypothetical protein Despr_0194 [Desulfobulbus propionicus DSM 2032]